MENILPKTGFVNPHIPDINIDDMIMNIQALITLFIENAIKNAEIYTLHANRKVIVPEDISRCLKAEIFMFLDRTDNEKKAKLIINEYNNELLNNNDVEEDNEENIENNKLFNEIIEYIEEYNISNCYCKECININKYNDKWLSWSPTNGVEKLLYDAIKKIDEEYKI